MRKLLVTTTAMALALFVGVGMARAADLSTPAATLAATTITSGNLIGRTVVNGSREEIGTIESVLIDKTGSVRYVIIAVGGFLGIGPKDVAVGWNDLSFDGNNQQIILNMTKGQPAALPAHRFMDPTENGKVSAYDDDLRANQYPANGAETATATTGSARTATAVDTKKLIGRNITNGGNDTVGEINSVLIDQGGNFRYVVVGVGEFLGMGEKDVALPWSALNITKDGGKVTANITKEQLKALPAYRFADFSRRGTVHAYGDDLKSNPFLASNAMSMVQPPFPGANSFTESQARHRIERNGYTNVATLKKDDQSIWRGTATKDGRSVNVALDYKGNVVAQ